MKRLFWGLCMMACLASCAGTGNNEQSGGQSLHNGKYTGIGLNFDGNVTATVTVRGKKIKSVEIGNSGSLYAQYAEACGTVANAIVAAQSTDVDGVSGATYSSNAVKEAVQDALEQSLGIRTKVSEQKDLTFMPGQYTTQSRGFGGMVRLQVTFSENAVTDVRILSHNETAHIGDMALKPVCESIVRANGTGADAVSGATVTSHAVKAAVVDAAMQAGLTNRRKFLTARPEVVPADDAEGTWDIVIIGGGGAGLFAAAQAVQDGNSVLVIEKNAEVGGNTIASGGLFQSVDHSLVWDMEHPEMTSAIGFDGKMHNKLKATVGSIAELKIMLGWNEDDFDESFYVEREFVAGGIAEISKHGVHKEFLPTLQALKKEISAYLAYAEPKLARGMTEDQLMLFSTTNLHIFQTYYGGLRQNAQKNDWIYSDYNLVKQFIEEGEQLKPWLMSMGVTFPDVQTILPGAMWYRCNAMSGCLADVDADGTMEKYTGNWGPYCAAPLAVIAKSKESRVMRSTNAGQLVQENGRVTGVIATRADGSKLTAHARKGVIIATGGYAANIEKVLRTNKYWSRLYLTPAIGTTNRSSLRGDGIEMAQALGAAVTGEGYTQLLPVAYSIDGSISLGGVQEAIFVSPATGKRFVDECSERDVLSLEAFRKGVDKDGSIGTFLYIKGGFGMGTAGMTEFTGNTLGKEWGCKGSEIAQVLKEMGLDTDPEILKQTIRDYDMAIMEGRPQADVAKRHPTAIIGTCQMNADGTYKKETYDLENADLRIRLLAPSSHHTMGGLVVDLERRVLDENGQPIPGLFAAGEVTGGIHGGNRLGGNALTEIMASGRIAARTAGRGN